MIKTQIQLPKELYQELKQLAEAKEWSLAETLRRGGECLLQQYPRVDSGKPVEPWKPPTSATVGWNGLNPEQLKQAARESEQASLT